MKKTMILLATAATVVMTGSAIAAETVVSKSVVTVDGLPADAYVSPSVVAYGEPPKPEPEKQRRFEVGFLPTVPPPPGAANGEEEKAEPAMAVEPMKASADGAEAEDMADEMNATGEVDVENMELRLE